LADPEAPPLITRADAIPEKYRHPSHTSNPL
jgi:hypothetical protein